MCIRDRKSHVQIRRAVNLQNASRAWRLGRDILVKELEEYGERHDDWFSKDAVQQAFIDENLHVLSPAFDLNLSREVAQDASRLLEENPVEASRLRAVERTGDWEKARDRLDAVLQYIREGNLKEG